MNVNYNERRDAWTPKDDAILTHIIITGAKEGITQLISFERAGHALQRTSKACGFRWNKVLRAHHEEELKDARKEWRYRSGKIRSIRVPEHLLSSWKELAEEDLPDTRIGGAKVANYTGTPIQLVEESKERARNALEQAKAVIEEARQPKETHNEFVERTHTPTRPSYYHKGGIDVIEFLDSHFGGDSGYTVKEAFCIGNIIKYVTRYKQKNGLEDLQKAEYYLNQLKQGE